MKKLLIIVGLFAIFVYAANKNIEWLGVLSLLTLLGYLIYLIVKAFKWVCHRLNPTAKPNEEQSKKAKESYYDVANRPTNNGKTSFWCTIAGTNFHCGMFDIGGFLGIACPQPTNPADPNAVAIYRMGDRKLLGYIPAAQTAEYKRWSNGIEGLLCIGFINFDKHYYGKVKVIYANDERIELRELYTLTIWLVREFGAKFIPEKLKFDGIKKMSKDAIIEEYEDKIEEIDDYILQIPDMSKEEEILKMWEQLPDEEEDETEEEDAAAKK